MFSGREMTEGTINLYTNNLKRLNDGEVPTSPLFLKNVVNIEEKIAKYAMNTKKSYYITIVSYLKDKKFPKKQMKFYTDKMMELNKQFRDKSSEKTQKQTENWISWEDVTKHYNELNPKSLEHMVLSLFTLIPPRRSKDFFLMKVIPKYSETMDKEFNYLDWTDMRMYFNNYKTKGAYGVQSIDVPPELQEVLHNHFPLKKKFEPFFLLTKNGERLPDNGITRILNKVFGKKVSVSMLRNIYLSDKYAEVEKDKKEDAEAMGTSTNVISNIYTKSA
jgi:integrase